MQQAAYIQKPAKRTSNASDAETSTANCQNELEASTLYYKNMIHTFQELQPKIRGELETLAQITLQANHGHIPLI